MDVEPVPPSGGDHAMTLLAEIAAWLLIAWAIALMIGGRA